ncbi:MAG: chorismate mutase [Candidatus Gastranaerophilales bacterium]|nr:chorismate mutase [Candidatus Gastranaerophilales bacterium]
MKQYKTCAIRGAISLSENSKQEISSSVVELLNKIVKENMLNNDDIISAIFTMTEDLNAEFPAKAARTHMGWNEVSMICARELAVKDSLPMCIRVLIHINTLMDKKDIKHVYLRDAANLRPDIAR